MATEVDIIMRRPRTPNDQYSILTEQQISNIPQNSSTFFFAPPKSTGVSIWGPPREGGRYYKDRYVDVTVGHESRGTNHNAYVRINEQIRTDLPIKHNTGRGMASVKWGPQKVGDRTRSHFFGEDVDRYTIIDMYRRPATSYTGRVVMDCGRPADGYYTQWFPNRQTWYKAGVPLNCKNILESVPRKTEDEHIAIRLTEQSARADRDRLWPHYSEYTDRFLMRTGIRRRLTNLEHNKQYAAEGQRLQKEEEEEKAALEAMKERIRQAMEESNPNKPNCSRVPLMVA